MKDTNKIDEAAAEVISKASEATVAAVSELTREAFAHYVAEHTNGENEVVTVTEFYEYLQAMLKGIETPTAEDVMSEFAEQEKEEKKSK